MGISVADMFHIGVNVSYNRSWPSSTNSKAIGGVSNKLWNIYLEMKVGELEQFGKI
jgi:hypothetical protein